jgi:3'-phosphoadenosine 5'-phosphosulfate sulfotransferase (PAPS reductase)/FAD synthetase
MMTEPTTYEWPELGEVAREAQEKLELRLKVEELEEAIKEEVKNVNHYRRVLNVLIESGAVTSVQVRKAHELLNEVNKN